MVVTLSYDFTPIIQVRLYNSIHMNRKKNKKKTRHEYVLINNRTDRYSLGYWLFHCHIEFHAEIGMSLIFKVGEDKEMPPVPNNFPKCGDWKPTNDENNETSTIPTITKSNNIYLADMIKQFAIYMTYFKQLLNVQTSSASSSSITLLLFIACLTSSMIRV